MRTPWTPALGALLAGLTTAGGVWSTFGVGAVALLLPLVVVRAATDGWPVTVEEGRALMDDWKVDRGEPFSRSRPRP